MPLDFLEKDLEDIIYENARKIHERGFDKFYIHKERQYYLPSGKKIDILTWEIKGDVFFGRIIELKKDKATEAALFQALGYFDELSDHLLGHFTDIKLSITLVGRDISYNVALITMLEMPTLNIYSYSYGLDGISFSNLNFSLKELVGEAKDRELTSKSLEVSALFREKENERIEFREKQRLGTWLNTD